jgi:Rps23 Pro-64 3,4-dihydroxylase Tpa1-like proline 4-hydroxylase
METRRLIIDNKLVVIEDDLVYDTEFSDFESYIKKSAAFTPSQSDSYASNNIVGTFWVYNIDIEKFSKSTLFKLLLDKTNKYFGKKSWMLTEARVNSTQHGDSGFMHTDGANGFTDTVTCLIYLNENWNPDFFGETIFYNEQDDACAISSLKYKRLVMFDGSIKHASRAPSRLCSQKRLIMVVKYASNNI